MGAPASAESRLYQLRLHLCESFRLEPGLSYGFSPVPGFCHRPVLLTTPTLPTLLIFTCSPKETATSGRRFGKSSRMPPSTAKCPGCILFPSGTKRGWRSSSPASCLYLLPRYLRLHLQQRGAAKPAWEKISKEEEPRFPFPAGASGLCI